MTKPFTSCSVQIDGKGSRKFRLYWKLEMILCVIGTGTQELHIPMQKDLTYNGALPQTSDCLSLT